MKILYGLSLVVLQIILLVMFFFYKGPDPAHFGLFFLNIMCGWFIITEARRLIK